MTRREYGIVLGRFQPLHVGHMEYLAAAHERCRRLVVGITNPDTAALSFHVADPKRSKQTSNPYSYFERYEMIDAALRGEGWDPETFAIAPADVNNVLHLPTYLPPREVSTVFITIYDAWGEEKVRRLESLGYAVEVLWRRDMSTRVASGTEIRERIQRGESWRHLVPPPVAAYIERAPMMKVSVK